MAGSVKGLLVEIGGDTSGLQKALKKVNSESSSLSKELKGINSLLKLDPKNTELLAQKQTVLTSNIKETEEKLKLLKQAQKEADQTIKNGGEISQENYRNLQREIASTQNKLKELTNEYKNFLTETSKITKAGKKMEEFGEKVKSGSEKISDFGDKVTSKATTGIIGLGTVAITTAASLESAVDNYIAKTNKSTEEAEKYKKVLTNINDANFGEGYEDIANSMAIVEQQMRGLDDAADLENITKKAYYLKDAFDSEVNESVRAAKMMMEQWGISADEAFELINQGYQKGLDKNGDFLDSINEYSVHFRQIGLSATDMFNTFSLGAKSGAFSIDKVGDAIKEMGIRLKDGSVTDVLKEMKLNAKDLEKAFAEGGEKGSAAFGKIVEGLQNIKDPLKQNQAGVAIFGTMWEDLGKDAVFAMTSYVEEFDETMDTMNTSMNKMYNNTKSNTQTTIKRIKTISANLGTKLLPIVNKVLDKAEIFIDKLDDLNDGQQDNIIKIGLLVASAGPLIKILGTAGSVIGTTSKGIGIFSQALIVAKNNSTSTSSSVNSLAGFLKGLVSPAGLVTTALLATAGAIAYFATKESEATKELKEHAQQAAESKQALIDYNKSIDDTANANLAQIESITTLKDELKTLVDENGKVKEGYEGRVSFILNELNSALGTEYQLNGNLISGYKDMQSEIDNLIEKKKAEIKLNASEEKYTNAIKNQAQAVEDLRKAQNDLNMDWGDFSNLINQLDKDWENYLHNHGEETELMKKYNYGALNTFKKQLQIYEDSKFKVQEYTNEIKQYEDEYAKYTEGKYDEIGNTITVKTEKWCDKSLEQINGSIEEQKKSLQEYKAVYIETGNQVALQNAQQAQRNLEDLAIELANRTKTVGDLGQAEIEAWKKMANNSYEAYSIGVSQMGPEMREKIQEITGVVVAGTPQMQEKAKELGEKTVAEFDKSADARKKALKTITGYLQGLTDDQKREFLKQAGIEDVDIVLEELKKGNLSEEHGKSILEGLYNGLKNNSWKDKIVGVASGLAKAVNTAFATKTNSSKGIFSFLPGHKSGLDYVPRDNYVARLHKGERVLTAEENKEYTKMLEGFKIPNYSKLQSNLATKMMSTTNTKNSYNIELKFYPQKMTQTELNNVFKFLNRKLGQLY